MGDDTIPMRIGLRETLRVIRMVSILNTHPDLYTPAIDDFGVVGRLLEVWGWANRNSYDGTIKRLSYTEIDQFVRRDGFAEAMRQVGWLEPMSGGGFRFPNFGEWNRCLPKKRAAGNTRSGLFVYFVQAGESGPIKIGLSDNPAGRVASLQTAHPECLRLLRVIPGNGKYERALHKRFAGLRLQGEWFKPDKTLLAYIDARKQAKE